MEGKANPPSNNPWVAILRNILHVVRSTPVKVVSAIHSTSSLVQALVVLAICGALAVLGYVLVYIIRPRPFTISHSTKFDEYMSGASNEVALKVAQLADALASGVLDQVAELSGSDLDGLSACAATDDFAPTNETLGSVKRRLTAALLLLKARPHLSSDVALYYRFHRSLKSMTAPDTPNMLARLDLKSEPAFLAELTGEVDPTKVAAFYNNVFVPMRQVRKHAVEASSRLHRACAITYDPETAQAVLDLHLLRMHLDTYHEQTTLSYETRKSGPGRLPTAIMTLYWWSAVEPTYTKSIPNLWTSAPKEFDDGKDAYEQGWDSLGPAILKLPCYMSHMDADERKSKCDGGASTEGFRESFSLGGLISGIGKLLSSIIPMFISIAMFVLQLATDPFGAIFGFVMLILGMVIGLVLYLIYVLLTITELYMIPGIVYAFVVSYVYAFILTVLEVCFTIILAIPYLILTLIDLVTGGLIMHLLRCEALPSDWAVIPFAAYDNVRRRLGIVCAAPCFGQGFVPALGGVACYCMPSDVPPFCPQQQLFRAFRAIPLGDPYEFDGFTADAIFHTLDPEAQQRQMAKAYGRKADFLGRCYSASAPYSYITRHMCSDLDTLLPEGTTQEDRARLDGLCRQVHCDFGPQPGAVLDPEELGSAPQAIMMGTLPRFPMCAMKPQAPVPAPLDGAEESRLGYLAMLFALCACAILVLLYALLG